MKNITKNLMLLALVAVMAVGCSKKEENKAEATQKEQQVTLAQVTTEDVDQLYEYTAVVQRLW